MGVVDTCNHALVRQSSSPAFLPLSSAAWSVSLPSLCSFVWTSLSVSVPVCFELFSVVLCRDN